MHQKRDLMLSSSGFGNRRARVLTRVNKWTNFSYTVYFYAHDAHIMQLLLCRIRPFALGKFEAKLTLLGDAFDLIS